MKKLVSLITVLALILQLGVISAFAAPTATDKTLFKDTSEIFGIYDCSYTYLSVLHVGKEYINPYMRNLTKKDFYKSEDFSFELSKYQLSSDKKTITATFTTYLSSIQYHGQYVFKKDKTGKVYFNAVDYKGVNRNIYKSYSDSDDFDNYLESADFNKTMLAEKSLLKKVNTANDQIDNTTANFDDSKPIQVNNYLDGFYPSSDLNQYITFEVHSDFNYKDYSGFYLFTRINYTIGINSYRINAKSFTVKNGVALYLQDPKNYMEITAPNRATVTNIKVVKDGKVIINQKVNLNLDK